MLSELEHKLSAIRIVYHFLCLTRRAESPCDATVRSSELVVLATRK